MLRRYFLRVFALAALLTAVPGCSEATLVGIDVDDPQGSWILWGGPTRSYRASAFYSDGSERDVSDVAAWTSSDETIATVSDHGVVTRVSTGQVLISASLDGFNASITVDIP